MTKNQPMGHAPGHHPPKFKSPILLVYLVYPSIFNISAHPPFFSTKSHLIFPNIPCPPRKIKSSSRMYLGMRMVPRCMKTRWVLATGRQVGSASTYFEHWLQDPLSVECSKARPKNLSSARQHPLGCIPHSCLSFLVIRATLPTHGYPRPRPLLPCWFGTKLGCGPLAPPQILSIYYVWKKAWLQRYNYKTHYSKRSWIPSCYLLL